MENKKNDKHGDLEECEDEKPWYLIDVDSSQYKVWSFIMTMAIIYCQVMGPIILCFPDFYMSKNLDNGTYEVVTKKQATLVQNENIIDVLYCIDICINFLKATRVNKDLRSIALNYL